MLPPAVIIYILVIGPIVNRYENDVIASIRPIVLINNEQFDELVKSTSAIRRLNEIFVFVILPPNARTNKPWPTTSWTTSPRIFVTKPRERKTVRNLKITYFLLLFWMKTPQDARTALVIANGIV